MLGETESAKSDRVLLIQTLKSTTQQALLEKFLPGNERPCHKNDFIETQDRLENLTSNIKELVESLVDNHFSLKSSEDSKSNQCHANLDNETLTLLLILCGQNNSSQPWNSEATIKNCDIILSNILQLLNCQDSFDLFSKSSRKNLIKNILQVLCHDLTPSLWKHFPASVVCYDWILKKITQPELGQYLELVLPPALLLTDDFVTENRIIGVKCLNHIIHNITIAELQLYGHGEVIYAALIPILRTREADLIEVTISPLVSLTTKLEFDLGRKHPSKWSRFDNILEIYLESMELEQKIDLRNCYIKNLGNIISNVGYNVIRWSKRLLRIFNEYIETAGKFSDESTIYHCVKVIEKFIEFSQDAAFLYGKNLLLTLQMALYSIISLNNNSECENLEVINRCIRKILQSLPQSEKEELQKDFMNNFSTISLSKKFYNHMYETFRSIE